MTAIMGLKVGKRIFVAGDGMISNGENMAVDVCGNETSSKIKRVKGSPNCLISCFGDANSFSAIISIENLFDGKEDPSYNYIVTKVLPKIYKSLEEARLITHKSDYCDLGCGLIIATKSHLYKISLFGIVTECKVVAFGGIGDLPSFATYMALRDKIKDPIELMTSCIKEAIKRCDRVGYPIAIYENNAKKEPIIINE